MTRPSLAALRERVAGVVAALITFAIACVIPLLFILALTAIGLILRSMGGAHVPFGAVR